MTMPRGETSTLASRAGLEAKNWQNAPRIFKKTWKTDILKLSLFIQETGVSESDTIRYLPFLLEDALFEDYQNALTHQEVRSMEQAKSVLHQIIGPTDIVDFNVFKTSAWRSGEETIYVFMNRLMTMAKALTLPDPVIKCQFLSGIPTTVARQLKTMNVDTIPCLDLAQKASELLSLFPEPVATNPIIDHSSTSEMVKRLSLLEENLAVLSQREAQVRCYKCQKLGHFARNCEKKGGALKCFSCGKMGHIARLCPKNGRRPVVRPANY